MQKMTLLPALMQLSISALNGADKGISVGRTPIRIPFVYVSQKGQDSTYKHPATNGCTCIFL
jgi:hypothetical protein